MKKILIPALLVVAGGGVGGAAAYATTYLLGAPAPAADGRMSDAGFSFIPAGKILAPLVGADGRLTGYVSFELQLEVPAGDATMVAARLPLVLHAINMRTYRTPLASGPDGMLPDIDAFRRVVSSAAAEALGSGVVRRVAVTQAVPA